MRSLINTIAGSDRQETRGVSGRRNTVEIVSRCSRGLVMLTCYLRTGGRPKPAIAVALVVPSAYFSALSTVPSAIFCTPTPQRDSFRSHTFSLFLALISTREPAFTRPPTARYCKLLTALLLSAYCLLSATPSSATLATPLLSTACGTIKLQLSYNE